MLINLGYILNVQISQGYNKDNLFTLFSNPCYFLYYYSLLKQNVAHNSDSILISNIILPAILSLSLRICDNIYKPFPIHEVYISKSTGRMRPVGIASALDKIVQKGSLII
jgi:retron-type reverse transcriptase